MLQKITVVPPNKRRYKRMPRGPDTCRDCRLWGDVHSHDGPSAAGCRMWLSSAVVDGAPDVECSHKSVRERSTDHSGYVSAVFALS